MCHSQSLVWYASYGSNVLYKDGFLCYIEGGIRREATKKENGCKDKTPPKKTKRIDVPFPLYFAEKSSRWNNGGVAFIGLSIDDKNLTAGRMYLIKADQFIDVVKQENGDREVIIDFEEVKKKGSKVFRQSWYGNIIYLGDDEGCPIFTFTHYKQLGSQPFNKPSPEYIKIIAMGLKEARNWGESQIVEYLIQKPGIKGNYVKEELKPFCNNAFNADGE